MEAFAHLPAVERAKHDDAFALLAGTPRAAQTMDVGFAVAREADLDDMSDIGEVLHNVSTVKKQPRKQNYVPFLLR